MAVQVGAGLGVRLCDSGGWGVLRNISARPEQDKTTRFAVTWVPSIVPTCTALGLPALVS